MRRKNAVHGTDTFRHIVLHTLAAEIGRKRSSSVSGLLWSRGHLGFGRSRSSRLGLGGLGCGFVEEFEQAGLIGTKLLALGTIEPAQQLIEPMLHAAQFAIARAEQIE